MLDDDFGSPFSFVEPSAEARNSSLIFTIKRHFSRDLQSMSAASHFLSWSFSFLAATAVASWGSPAFAIDFRAADGRSNAVVEQRDDCTTEIVIHSRSHAALKLFYAPQDHQHGSCLQQAEWSANSRFFVFALSDSANRRSGLRIQIYSRETNDLHSLTDFLAEKQLRHFSLAAPDWLIVDSIQGGDGIALSHWIALGKLGAGCSSPPCIQNGALR